MIPVPLVLALEDLARGVVEFPDSSDPKENPRILEYQAVLPGGIADDETPWCSAFAAGCVQSGGYGLAGVTHAARSWLAWGEAAGAHVGAVTVLWRVEPRGWQGHVGFLLDHSRDLVFLLGGNQGNRVSVRAFPKGNVLGYRQPKGGW